MNRRSFLATTIAAAAVPAAHAAPGSQGGRLDRTRVSAITDEIARSPREAIEFAHKYGMKWLSLRDTPAPAGAKKKAYYALPPEELKQAVRELKDAGVGVAFLDAPFLKFGLPGSEPKGKASEAPAAREKRFAADQVLFDRRLADLRQGIVASHAYDCRNIRIFTFNRVEEPESIFPRIAEVITEMAEIAAKDGVRLLIENETSQNAGTAAETAKLLKLLPANVGVNWDTLNAVPLGEKTYPDGYEALKNDRVWNVHVKGKSLLDYPDHLDWPAILNALERDGFEGYLELETHIFGDGQVEASHASMKELMRLLDARKAA